MIFVHTDYMMGEIFHIVGKTFCVCVMLIDYDMIL